MSELITSSAADHNVVCVFRDAARRYPQRTAIQTANEAVSFAGLCGEVDRLAAAYLAVGLQAGDRVLVFIPVGPGLYRVVLSLLTIGAVPVFLDQWSSLQRMRASARVADCRALVAGRKVGYLSYLFAELRGLTKLKAEAPTVAVKPTPEAASVAPGHPALITFTTGSTGTPKAAVRTHAVLRAQLDALRPLLEASEVHKDATLLPIVVLLNLAIGRTTYLPTIDFRRPARFSPQVFCAELASAQVTSVTGSPYYLIATARHLAQTGGKLALERVLIGGAPVWPRDARALVDGFAGANVTVVYGSTEAEPISHVDGAHLAASDSRAGLLVGRVDPAARVRIESSAEIGEVLVSGSHVVDRYLNDEAAFRQNKLRDADGTLWHRTGDLAKLESDGSLRLFGRVRECVRLPSGPVYPFILEPRLCELPGVAHAALVVVDGCLVAVYEGDADAEGSLKDLLTAELGEQHLPVKRLKAMPLDPRHHGKVDYDQVRRLVN